MIVIFLAGCGITSGHGIINRRFCFLPIILSVRNLLIEYLLILYMAVFQEHLSYMFFLKITSKRTAGNVFISFRMKITEPSAAFLYLNSIFFFQQHLEFI